jgi:hypothetical protein
MRHTPTMGDPGNAAYEAFAVVAWLLLTCLLIASLIDSAHLIDLGSVWTWLIIAAMAVWYPVLTVLVFGLVTAHLARFLDRRHH